LTEVLYHCHALQICAMLTRWKCWANYS